jgi:arylsulfatase
MGETDNTIVVFTTDNGAEVFTWPDGGMTPFKATKGTVYEGGFRAPAIIRWPGKIKPGAVENGIFSALDWFPTLVAAAGDPDITEQLLKGFKLGDRTYKNHLDGYNQLGLLMGKSPSARHEFFYFGGLTWVPFVSTTSNSSSFSSRKDGLAPKLRPTCPPWSTSARTHSSATPSIGQQSLNDLGGGYMNDFYAREFWRFVSVQEEVKKLALTAIDYPPMQDPASFNLDAVKKEIDAAIREKPGN